MADVSYRPGMVLEGRSRASWGAIFGGTFAFLAIWATFGVLGLGVFASAANPRAAAPVAGMNVGESIWVIILSIIVLYVGGRIASGLSGAVTRRDGVTHGLITFGLCVFTAILIAVATVAVTLPGVGTAPAATTHNPTLLGGIADSSWALFVALILGGIAAMAGGMHGLPRAERREVTAPTEVRKIA